MICILAAAALGGAFIYRRQQAQSAQHITSTNSYNMADSYRTVSYEGRTYKYNSLITTILLIGVDNDGEIRTYPRVGEAPRADSIHLMVLDKKNKRMTILNVNRDTMTEIRRYSFLGDSFSYYVSQLAYSTAYSMDLHDGAEYTCEAVSKLLKVPVNEYVLFNRSSLTSLNNMVGGVTVTVPNDDLVEKYPQATAGSQMVITDENMEDFVRYRDINRHYSNDSRMDRQRAYISAFVEKVKGMIPDQVNSLWTELEKMDSWLITSVTKNKYLSYANTLSEIEFSDGNYYKMEGEVDVVKKHIQFHHDEEALRKLVLDIFYEAV